MKYQEIVKAVNDILSQYTAKLTLRQIYYRLVSKNLIPNTKSSYKGLSKHLVHAREKGDVNDYKIEDRSRKVQGYGDYGYTTIEGFVESAIQDLKTSWKNFIRKQWVNQDKKIFIALEKDALSRLFVNIADSYRVQVYTTKGYGSYTFVNDMARDLSHDKENVILYFGDYDPSGRDIERDLRDRLIRYFGNDNFTVVRIALTETQILEYNLPPMPEDAETLAKLERDTRSKSYGLEYAVELDAIEPPILQKLISKAITEQIDIEQWNKDLEQNKRDREILKEKFDSIKVVFNE